jgi:predicted SAM-dependent methyltransferase
MKDIKDLVVKFVKGILQKTGYRLVNTTMKDDLSLYIKLYGEESVKNRFFYNVSAGAYMGFGGGLHHPCWTNIDINKKWNESPDNPKIRNFDSLKDIDHDLLSMEPIPVESSSAELVHTRFTIASLTNEAAQFMFNEVFRMLKSGGIFRISSPNIDLDYRAYLNNDRGFFFWFNDYSKVSIEQAFLYHVASQASVIHNDGPSKRISDEDFRNLIKNKFMQDALDLCTSKCSLEVHKGYRQNHINWWNPEKLEKMLYNSGFRSVYFSTRGQSGAPVMRNEAYFDNEDNKFVMYIEAVK